MRVAILGAGPAGLYAAYLLRKQGLASEICLIEQNPPDATFGFGVVFSDRALAFLQEDDPDTHALIAPDLESWDDVTINHQGQSIRIDGVGFSAIGRLRLLQLLQRQVAALGVQPRFRCAVADIAELGQADLIIGADGVNSRVRRSAEFGTRQSLLTNRFAWYGTGRRFDTLTHTFKRTGAGHFNAHHYRYSPEMSTFIVEVDAATYDAAGFDRMGEEETRGYLEAVFGEELGGHGLVSNKSTWRQFPTLWNARWWVSNRVLVGDALHTAHFSIGSGTRLALEDVVALVRALEAYRGDLPAALAAYEAARRPVVEKLVEAANASAAWYEDFPRHMALEPWAFAESYVMRSGRVSPARLAQLAPRFARELARRASPNEGAP